MRHLVDCFAIGIVAPSVVLQIDENAPVDTTKERQFYRKKEAAGFCQSENP